MTSTLLLFYSSSTNSKGSKEMGGGSSKENNIKASDASKDQKELEFQKFTMGETFGADEAFMEKLRNKIKENNIKKSTHHIVFCPITSRVGSDVVAALESVNEVKGIILVLMHHTRDPDYSTGGTSWSETMQAVDLDVNILFHETKPGLLSCSQNDTAVRQICTFMKKQKTDKKDKKEEKSLVNYKNERA